MNYENKNKTKKSDIVTCLVLLAYCVAYCIVNDFIEPLRHFSADSSSLQTIVRLVPALLQSAFVIVLAAFLYKLLNHAYEIFFNRNAKLKTALSLFLSVARWVVIIVAFLFVLSAFGVDTATLLAGAGIITLVIGLGAQSLISDILAGFFLVFEGEYEVGDIVSIDGWRGTVKSIGIRVTQLEDVGGNVKTINNSDVRNVVNQTNELSVAKVTMPIDYGENLERVEKILEDSFAGIKERVPAIEDGPFYKGVSELGESSVNLLIVAKCREDNIYQVQRDLTRELYLIYNKNRITVPFNQIVVSKRED